ncbi:MAG: ectonucleotide pyrophosphatase/phosphodiesterase [Pyrinomonadaceae bacterium]
MKSLLKLLVLFAITFAGSHSLVFGQKVKDLQPTVILISLDGFRNDYLDKHKPANLQKLIKRGTRAEWLQPSFPTKTFPNHYTIVTGLYPSHHGIIENNIYDPIAMGSFSLGNRAEVQDPRWWKGEPIWVTAKKQGLPTAAFFFPGTETAIQGIRPDIWREYDGKIENSERVDAVLDWLAMPREKRPRIITMYFSDTDDTGHAYGPDSKELKATVLKVDKDIGRLLSGLKRMGIEKKVNVIVVSDHGMAPVPKSNKIILDEMFDVSLTEKIMWIGEFVQIFPKEGQRQKIYDSIESKLPNGAKIYKREELPARFHYSGDPNIAPLIVLPPEGWVLTTRARYERGMADAEASDVTGSHGYDNELESMRAIFIGAGPAFRKRYVAKPFANIEVYNVMCRILGIAPAANDGDINFAKDLLRKGR